MKRFFILLLVIILTGCTSIPFGSMIKLASMNTNELLLIKPDQIRARITLDEPAKLQTKDVNLVLRFEYSGEGESEYRLVLKLLNQGEKLNSSGWFSAPLKRHQYEFKVSQNSIEEFKKYQKEFVKFGKPDRYYWTVYYYLQQRPEKDKPINLDMELKLSATEEYFYLLKGADLDVK